MGDFNKNKKKVSNKVVLVTGGAGFIGSHLCRDLLRNNNEVRCLDNLSTGNKENICDLESNKSFFFTLGDINDMSICENITKDVDIVYHHAALGSVPRSITDPIGTNKSNIDGFLNMIVASKNNGVDRFIYAASSSTYGDSITLPKVESEIGTPLSPYAVTKYVNELYAEVFFKIYGLNSIGLRYFNVFGMNQNPNGPYAAVIPKFIEFFMNSKSPTIHGDGSNSRDFTFVENVIQMNHLAGITNNKDAFGKVFNVACGERTTLNELSSLIRDIIAQYDPKVKRIQVEYGPERPGDVAHSLASIDRAKKILGYEPSYNLEDGLKETVLWFLDQ